MDREGHTFAALHIQELPVQVVVERGTSALRTQQVERPWPEAWGGT